MRVKEDLKKGEVRTLMVVLIVMLGPMIINFLIYSDFLSTFVFLFFNHIVFLLQEICRRKPVGKCFINMSKFQITYFIVNIEHLYVCR